MTDDGKILMFSTAENLQNLSSSSAWFGDGTFSVTPPLFYQFFTIFAIFSAKQCLLYIACSQRNQNLCMCRLSKKKCINHGLIIIFVMNIYGTMTSMLKNQILFCAFNYASDL